MIELTDILQQFGPGLARVAAAYEADAGLREDLLQEILLAIHQSMPRLREADSLSAYVFRIAHNRATSHALRERAQKLRAKHAHWSEPIQTPEDSILEHERTQRVFSLVRRLPLPYRQVIMLSLEGLSHREISEALGLSLSNVAVRINRAKNLLKDLQNDR